MGEVDIFWAYGLGGTLAAAAGKQLEKEEKPLSSSYFAKTMVFLSLVWAPTGMWLLLNHPSWETMQAAESLLSMPAWLIIGFGMTNITQGMLGFWVTTKLIQAKKIYLAHLNWLAGYLGMFFILLYGWDGLGYDRFLYDRDMFGGLAWQPGFGLQEGAGILFFTSSVALALYGLGVYLLPPLFMIVARWTLDGNEISGVASPTMGQLVRRHLGTVFVVGLGTAAFAAIVVYFVGQLIGAGSAASRWDGSGGNMTMHYLSYVIGLGLSAFILAKTVYRRGGIVNRHFESLNPALIETMSAEESLVSSGVVAEGGVA